MKRKDYSTDTLILPKGKGRVYNCGKMTAIFKADKNKYSISEWCLEPNSNGQVAHLHEANDEFFYGLEGTISILVGDKWINAEKGIFLRIPPKKMHDFKNQTSQKTGVLHFFYSG